MRPATDAPRRALAWLLLAAGVALAYTVVRAASLAFTYDESLTLRLVERPLYEIVTLSKPIANNHVLNTVLIKAIRGLLGNGELVYRLPNLAAHAVYLGIAVLLARSARGTVQALAAFAALAACPYLLDYFSLARGYGLALACELAACAALVEHERSASVRWTAVALVASTAAVASNLAFLSFHVALTAVLGLLALGARPVDPRRVAIVAAWGIAVVAAAARPLGKLWAAGELYYGGHASFWQDTVGSLSRGIAYAAPYEALLAPVIPLVLAGVVVGGALSRSRGSRMLFGIAALLTGLAIVQHAAAGTPWPLGRTALPFLPPVLVLGARLLASAPRALAAAAAVLVGGHAIATANASWAYDWRYGADVRSAIETVVEARDATKADRVRLLVSWPFEESALFYAREWDLGWLDCAVAEQDAHPELFDFYYVLAEDQPFGFRARSGELERPGRTIVRSFPASGSYLLADGKERE